MLNDKGATTLLGVTDSWGRMYSIPKLQEPPNPTYLIASASLINQTKYCDQGCNCLTWVHGCQGLDEVQKTSNYLTTFSTMRYGHHTANILPLKSHNPNPHVFAPFQPKLGLKHMFYCSVGLPKLLLLPLTGFINIRKIPQHT